MNTYLYPMDQGEAEKIADNVSERVGELIKQTVAFSRENFIGIDQPSEREELAMLEARPEEQWLAKYQTFPTETMRDVMRLGYLSRKYRP